MNPFLDSVLKTRRVRSPQGGERELGSEISLDEGYLLQEAIQLTQAVTTLEIGLWYGVSTLFICEAISGKPGAHHIVMDPNQFRDCDGIGLNNVKEAGYENIVEFYGQSSHIVLPQLELKGVKVDFAFVDASHLFDYTLLEFFYIDRILRTGGIIAFDDASMPGVQKVIRFIITNRCYKVVQCIPASASWKQMAKHRLLKEVSRICPPLKQLIRPELREPDIDRGFIPGARYVALRKEADDSEDTRPWHFYHDF